MGFQPATATRLGLRGMAHCSCVRGRYPELIVNCTSMYPLETEFWCSSFALYRGDVIYNFLEKFLAEITALLPNQVFHIGGDEVGL